MNMGAAFQHELGSRHKLSRVECHRQGPPQSPGFWLAYMALFFPQHSYHRTPPCQNDLPAFTPASLPASELPRVPCSPASLSMQPSITFLKSNHRVKKKKKPQCGLPGLSLAVPSGRHWSFLCFSAPFHNQVSFFKDNFSLSSIH